MSNILQEIANEGIDINLLNIALIIAIVVLIIIKRWLSSLP